MAAWRWLGFFVSLLELDGYKFLVKDRMLSGDYVHIVDSQKVNFTSNTGYP